MENRDEILKMSDADLSARCDLEFMKDTGNGGQHRNRTMNAVRVRLRGTEFTAWDCSERSQHRNRANALEKLRRHIALTVRQSPPLPPERPDCAITHPDYPAWLAHVLDILEAHTYDHKAAAAALNRSPTSLIKKLARDPEAWQWVNTQRLAHSRPPLQK